MGRHQVVPHVAVPVEIAIVFVAATVRVNATRTGGAEPAKGFSFRKLLGVTNRCGEAGVVNGYHEMYGTTNGYHNYNKF